MTTDFQLLHCRCGSGVLWWAYLSVCLHTYLSKHTSKLHRICCIFSRDHGLAFFWQHYNTLCTSSFVDDIIFAVMVPKVVWRYCSSVSAMLFVFFTLLLCGIGCVLSWTTAGSKTRWVLHTWGTRGRQSIRCTIVLLLHLRKECEVWSIVINMSVYLSVCSHISKTTWLHFAKFFFVHVACGHGSKDFFFWRCNTLCTSGFVDDSRFYIMGPMMCHVWACL